MPIERRYPGRSRARLRSDSLEEVHLCSPRTSSTFAATFAAESAACAYNYGEQVRLYPSIRIDSLPHFQSSELCIFQHPTCHGLRGRPELRCYGPKEVRSIMKLQAIQVLHLLDLHHIRGDGALLDKQGLSTMAPFLRSWRSNSYREPNSSHDGQPVCGSCR